MVHAELETARRALVRHLLRRAHRGIVPFSAQGVPAGRCHAGVEFNAQVRVPGADVVYTDLMAGSPSASTFTA